MKSSSEVKNHGVTAAAFAASVRIAADGDTVCLSWDAAENAAEYVICRAAGKYSTYVPVATVTDTCFADTVPAERYKYYYKVAAKNADGDEIAQSGDVSMDAALFGDTMTIYSPSDDPAQIHDTVNTVAEKMHDRMQVEFSEERYAFLFKPGNYLTPLFADDPEKTLRVGFYTAVHGLGITPTKTVLPAISVPWGRTALTNFWRNAENFAVEGGSPEREITWAVSQAAPLRRLYINGKLQLDEAFQPTSGGFLADSLVTGLAGSRTQQQFFVRNSVLKGGWEGGLWNMLFMGTENAPATSEDWDKIARESYMNIERMPAVREKPFLYLDEADGNYKVFVPAVREDSVGVSWTENDAGAGRVIAIEDFYVAKAATDSADTINAALDSGKHLLLTPGIYKLDQAVRVTKADTVVLGLGWATIVPTAGNIAMQVADVDGVTIAGVLFDADTTRSTCLLQVGEEGKKADHSQNPTLLADVFTRVGGYKAAKVDASVVVNSNDVLCDHLWLWRADHGTVRGATGWTKNESKNGLVVNGDNVTCYGLFVEHFQEYQTLWNGDNGRTYFYQSEIPYDPPCQDAYMSHDGTVKGYASYKVADDAKGHRAVALGIYDVFIHNPEWAELENAMEVAEGTEVQYACILSLGRNGGTNHIVNGTGEGVRGGTVQKTGIKRY